MPVPADAFGHRPEQETQEWRDAVAYDRGRRVFEANRCVSCHARGDAREVERAPELSDIGARAAAAWIYQWLEDPQRYRPGTEMPALFDAERRRRGGAGPT